MKYGIAVMLRNVHEAIELAEATERAGWDGFFTGEAVWITDAWVTLGAAAVRTNRIRLGTMVTPMPLMKPWKLAGETATLDNLSHGRAILSLGMGAVWMGYQGFPNEATDTRVRAELLDEGIDILTLLYRGKQFDYDGKHYQLKLTALDEMHYPPPPVQQPRLPIWVVGVWPRMKSMRRVLKCDGLLPAVMNEQGQFIDLQPEHVRAMKTYIDANRSLETPFDIVVEGRTDGLDAEQARAKIEPWIDAGATWWMEALYEGSHAERLARVRQGPPK